MPVSDTSQPPGPAPWLRHIGRIVGLAIGQDGADPPAIDSGKRYELAELIDLAQRTNPETRIAWERAREAALAVGINEAIYAPMLCAKAAAYQRVPLPRTILTPDGFFTADTQDFLPALTFKWQLFDFGGQGAAPEATREALAAANFGFNATHQKIVFDVTRAYYALNAVQGRVEVARISLYLARSLQDAAESRCNRGLTTLPEVLQAQERSARAAYELQELIAGETDARAPLLEAMGVLPATLRVVGLGGRRLRAKIEGTAEKLIDTALAQHPDLLARVAMVRAREAETARNAQVALYPNIGIAGDFSQPTPEPAWQRLVALELPHEQAARQVVKAYEDFKAALARREAAVALLAASERSYRATIDSYRNGIATFVDVSNTQAALIKSRTVDTETRIAVFTSATALAFSTGDRVQP